MPAACLPLWAASSHQLSPSLLRPREPLGALSLLHPTVPGDPCLGSVQQPWDRLCRQLPACVSLRS